MEQLMGKRADTQGEIVGGKINPEVMAVVERLIAKIRKS